MSAPEKNGKRPITLAVAIDLFLDEKSENLSRYSVIHLRNSLRPLPAALGNPPIATITYAMLRDYVEGLYLRYKPGTIKPIVGDMRQFFKWCKKRGHTRRNVGKRLRPPGDRVLETTARLKAAQEEDVKQLIEYLSSGLTRQVYRDIFGNLCTAPDGWTYEMRQTARDLFIVVFLHETGARAGELWRLGTNAMREATTGDGNVYRVVSTGKTSAVTLWFTRATLELWHVWQAVRPAGCDEYAITVWHEGKAPGPMSTVAISRTIARQCVRAGVGPFRAHALRHAKIKRSAEAVGLAVTSRLIGHSNLAVTAGYAATGEQELIEAARKTGLHGQLWARSHGSHP